MEQPFIPINPVRQAQPHGMWVDYAEVTPVALPELDLSAGTLSNFSPACVRLDWEDLQCFESVERQFQQWGVTFVNAVALRPSNPAYPPRLGVQVVIGAPKSGWLEATFSRPVQFVSGWVTSSRLTVLTAFDDQGQQVAQAQTPGQNLAFRSKYPPNLRLKLRARNICRVTFQAAGGEIALSEFCFG